MACILAGYASVRFLVWGTLPLGALLGGLLGSAAGVLPALRVAVGLGAIGALPVAFGPFWSLRVLPRPEAAPAD